MTNCPKCGSSVRSGAGYCPHCGEILEPAMKMPLLDLKNPETSSLSERMESFPPLLDQAAEQGGERSSNQPESAAGTQPRTFLRGSKGRNILLLAVIIVVISSAALAAVCILLPELKRADKDPVFYLCEGLLYMDRGSKASYSCIVYDLSNQMQSAEDLYGGKKQASDALYETFFYDEDNETLYFMDFQDSLFRVKINRSFGKKNIQDRVKLISGHVFSPELSDEGPMKTDYSVLPETNQVFFLRLDGKFKQLCVCIADDTLLLANDAEAYSVSQSGESVLFLQRNPAPVNRSEYTMYVCSAQSGDLIKIDSKVSSVEKLDGSFDLVWYTRYDPENTSGPVSVWIGGKAIDNEQVLSDILSCGGFSDSGFFYSVQATRKLKVWDYMADVDPGSGEYKSYSTLRGVLKNSTFERKSQAVSFWSESGSLEVASNVASWEVLNTEKGLLSMQIYDFAPKEILGIEDVRSAFSAKVFLENTAIFMNSFFSFGGGAAFKGEGLTYCCISPEGDEVWMIDNSGGRGVLYSCSVSENGFIDRTKLASDVFAAAYWPERKAVLFASDYNKNTKRSDLYVLEEGAVSCVSYDVYLPGREVRLFNGGAAIAYLKEPVFTGDTGEASLYYYYEGESILLARGVSDYACASFDRVFYLSNAAKGNPELFSYNGEHEAIAKGVWAVCAPGLQTALPLKGN